MLYFLLTWTALLFTCSTIGLGLLNGLKIALPRSSDRWILSVWLGVILLASLLLGVALIAPLSPVVGLLVAASLIGLSLVNPQVRMELRHLRRSIAPLIHGRTVLLCGAGLLLLAAITSHQVTWVDTGLYHYPVIQWLSQVGVVPGIALLFANFGFNSTWFALAAPLSPGAIGPQVCAVLGGWVLLLALLQIGIIARLIWRNQATFSDWFLGIFTLLLLLCSLIFSNLREIAVSPSPDVPVGFLTGLIPWSMLLIHQTGMQSTSGKTAGTHTAIVPLILAIGAVTLKLIALPLLAISGIFYLSHIIFLKKQRWFYLGIGLSITFLLFAPFLAAQIQTSGCPFFPSARFCLDISSAVSADVSQSVSQLTHDWLSWYRVKQSDISPFSAFFLWLSAKRSNQLLALMAVGSLLAVVFLYRLLRRMNERSASWVIATQVASMGFHAVTTLFFRFALPSLLLIPALLLALYSVSQSHRISQQWHLKDLLSGRGQKIQMAGLALLICCVIIVGDRTGWPLLLPPALQPVRVTLKRVNDFYYFSPENDELCWGTQIPCAFEIKPDVRLREPDRGVAGGFVRQTG